MPPVTGSGPGPACTVEGLEASSGISSGPTNDSRVRRAGTPALLGVAAPAGTLPEKSVDTKPSYGPDTLRSILERCPDALSSLRIFAVVAGLYPVLLQLGTEERLPRPANARPAATRQPDPADAGRQPPVLGGAPIAATPSPTRPSPSPTADSDPDPDSDPDSDAHAEADSDARRRLRRPHRRRLRRPLRLRLRHPRRRATPPPTPEPRRERRQPRRSTGSASASSASTARTASRRPATASASCRSAATGS